MGLHDVCLVAVNCPDGKGTGAGQGPCFAKGFIPGGGLGIESLADLFSYFFKFVHAVSFNQMDADEWSGPRPFDSIRAPWAVPVGGADEIDYQPVRLVHCWVY